MAGGRHHHRPPGASAQPSRHPSAVRGRRPGHGRRAADAIRRAGLTPLPAIHLPHSPASAAELERAVDLLTQLDASLIKLAYPAPDPRRVDWGISLLAAGRQVELALVPMGTVTGRAAALAAGSRLIWAPPVGDGERWGADQLEPLVTSSPPHDEALAGPPTNPHTKEMTLVSTAISSHGGYDVIVVGAGIIGAAIALELAERGLRVACAGDSAETLGTASSTAGAMLGALGEVTAGQDDPLDEAKLFLRHEAARAWPAFAARIQERTGQSLPIRNGTFVIANILNARDTVNLAAIAADRLDLPHEPISPAEVPYLQPAPGHQPIGALWLPQEGYIDTSLLLPAVHTALVTHPKISYFPALVTEILHDTQRVTGAVLANGTRLAAETIVLAAGVGTQALLDQVGPHTAVTARLLPGKGHLLHPHRPRPAPPPRDPHAQP